MFIRFSYDLLEWSGLEWSNHGYNRRKRAKVKRRTAKAKFIRFSNALHQLIDNDRNTDEINESFEKLELAYQDLEKKHEVFCETIEDDTQFLEEGTWLEESSNSFFNLKIQVKDHLAAKAADGKPDVKEVLSSSKDNQASASRGATIPCQVQMERPRLPRFSGDVREYSTFRSDFQHLIGTRYPKRDAITILRTCLQGKPLELIRGIGNDYDAAWAYLETK